MYKYTWEVILCIVLIDDEYLGPDIWPEILNYAKGTKEIMRTIWAEEAHCQQMASEMKTCLLSPSSKEAKHVSPLISCYVTIGLLN